MLYAKGFLLHNLARQSYGMAPLLRATLLEEAQQKAPVTLEKATTDFVSRCVAVLQIAAELKGAKAEVTHISYPLARPPLPFHPPTHPPPNPTPLHRYHTAPHPTPPHHTTFN
jgi:hypothetical protein